MRVGAVRVAAVRVVIAGVVVGAGALLSACSGQSAGAPPATSVAPKPQSQQVELTSSTQDVDCSANGGGKVGSHQAALVAVGSKAGRVECAEARNIVNEYFDNASKAEGSDQRLTVKGWDCGANAGPGGTSVVTCAKNSLSFHTGPISGLANKPVNAADNGTTDGSTVEQVNLKFPNTTQIVDLLRYDPAADMVEFRLMQWIPGGANNGHFVPVPADPAVHRLPLASNPTVLSALSLCPGAMAVDKKGLGTNPCTKDRLLAVLKSGQDVLAEIKVDGNDRVTSVSERYTP